MTGKSVVALVVGAVIGLPMGAFVGGAVHAVLVQKASADARRGWMLAPVVVAARPLAPGELVKFEDVSLRSIPEQFVTTSLVKPDGASYIVNQAVLVPVAAGEPLRWSYFQVTKARSAGTPGEWLSQEAERAACAEAAEARGFVPKAKTPEAIRAGLQGNAR